MVDCWLRLQTSAALARPMMERGSNAPPPHNSRRTVMTSAKYILLPAICALAVAVATPALALNPQPLPPGYQSHAGATFAATGHTTTFNCVAGGHRGR
jgi:hypothetical protein